MMKTWLGHCITPSSAMREMRKGSVLHSCMGMTDEPHIRGRRFPSREEITIIASPAKGGCRRLDGNSSADEAQNLNRWSASIELAGSTASQQSWILALAWFRECQEDHDICRIKNWQEWQPTRLIDVGENDSSILTIHIQ